MSFPKPVPREIVPADLTAPGTSLDTDDKAARGISKRPAHGMVGSSPALLDVLARARRVAPTRASVLVGGETGTGKELLARYVHAQSGRRGRFVAVNCSALPTELLESELFGHVKGAFTGAGDSKAGLFEAANAGTLFLDEIGDMELTAQAKVLRVIQEGAVRRVGGRREQRVDVRIVAASHRDLRELVAAGTFREDLLHRVGCYPLHLPALRERGRDVVAIARDFLRREPDLRRDGKPRGLRKDADDLLLSQPWTGNVRELRNVLFAAALEARGRMVGVDHLRPFLSAPRPEPEGEASELRWRVCAVLEREGPVGAADLRRALGVSRSVLHRELAGLCQEAVVAAQGRGRATRYATGAGSAPPLTDRQRLALVVAGEDGRVTRAVLADRAAVSIRTAGRDLATLVRLGLLVRDGRGATGGYVVPSEP